MIGKTQWMEAVDEWSRRHPVLDVLGGVAMGALLAAYLSARDRISGIGQVVAVIVGTTIAAFLLSGANRRRMALNKSSPYPRWVAPSIVGLAIVLTLIAPAYALIFIMVAVAMLTGVLLANRRSSEQSEKGPPTVA